MQRLRQQQPRQHRTRGSLRPMILRNRNSDEIFVVTQGKKEKESGTNSEERFPPCRRKGSKTLTHVSHISNCYFFKGLSL